MILKTILLVVLAGIAVGAACNMIEFNWGMDWPEWLHSIVTFIVCVAAAALCIAAFIMVIGVSVTELENWIKGISGQAG